MTTGQDGRTETIERTGATLQRQMSVMRARCVARYQMHSVPGRPEELVANHANAFPASAPRTISFGYACGSIRIRKHGGPRNRDWVETIDIQIKDGWLDDVYTFLDSWMGYAPPSHPIIRQSSIL